MAEAESHVSSKNLALRMEKKIASKMSTKRVANLFIDDTLAGVLDNLSAMLKQYTGNKKDADKVIKNIIKVTIKIGILYRNDQFSPEELALAEAFRKKFRTLVMTVVSFHEVAFSYDKAYLTELLDSCAQMLTQLVEHHLRDKSVGRIDHVFKFFSNSAFMETVFTEDTPLKCHLDKIVVGLNKLLEGGHI
ncbi:tumor necrosis factor alpha-induced protein 8-like protein 1 [Acanthaster planci]|uniref:Tumor necrosis factor alpha-induced protein 8-like protein 1 n=1 Tax=Acanthaster planci TaxID=133434 RepID=A0A8B7ZIN2_ACAPL|nr:tumor necrosis factor alpha-induced protein 8-like protein 1 [Acanthaster planci]